MTTRCFYFLGVSLSVNPVKTVFNKGPKSINIPLILAQHNSKVPAGEKRKTANLKNDLKVPEMLTVPARESKRFDVQELTCDKVERIGIKMTCAN